MHSAFRLLSPPRRPGLLHCAALIAGSLCLASVATAQPKEPPQPPASAPVAGPDIKIEPFHVPLGILAPLEERSVDLTITNAGDAPAVLLQVTTSCSCTAPDFKEPITIPPGGKHVMPLHIRGRANVGPLHSQANFFFENISKPLTITLAGDVSRAIKADPFVIDVLDFPKREPKPAMNGSITLTSVDGAPFRVLTVQGEVIKDSKPETSHTVRYDFRGVEQTDMPIWFVVETDHPKAPLIEMRVGSMALLHTGQGTGPWDLESDIVMLDRVPAGKTVTREIELTGLRDANAPVEFVSGRGLIQPHIAGETMGVRGRRFTVEFTPALGVSGFAHDKLVIRAKGHERSVDMYASVRGGSTGG